MLLPKRITTLLVKNANPLFSFAHKLFPNRLENYALLKILNALAKEYLYSGELDFMQDKIAKVTITDLDLSWFFTLSNHENVKNKRLILLNSESSKADVMFSGGLNAMVLMASQKVDPDTLFFKRQLNITGDTELGLEIKNLIDQFDISLLQKPVRQVLDIWSESLLEVQNA